MKRGSFVEVVNDTNKDLIGMFGTVENMVNGEKECDVYFGIPIPNASTRTEKRIKTKDLKEVPEINEVQEGDILKVKNNISDVQNGRYPYSKKLLSKIAGNMFTVLSYDTRRGETKIHVPPELNNGHDSANFHRVAFEKEKKEPKPSGYKITISKEKVEKNRVYINFSISSVLQETLKFFISKKLKPKKIELNLKSRGERPKRYKILNIIAHSISNQTYMLFLKDLVDNGICELEFNSHRQLKEYIDCINNEIKKILSKYIILSKQYKKR